VSSWIAEEVAAELAELPSVLRLDGGVVGVLEAVQELSVGAVEVAVRQERLAVSTPIEGVVDVELQTLLGQATETLTWTGTMHCTFEVILDGGAVVAQPHAPEAWGLDLVIGESSDALDAMVGAVLEEGLRAAMEVDPPGPAVIAELPLDSVRALRLRPLQEHVVVEVAFEVLRPGQVAGLPVPRGGWAAVVPEQTALSLARAEVLREAWVEEIIEPVSLDLRPDHFRLGVRQHLAQGPARRRFYEVRGTLELVEGELVARPDRVELLGGAVKAPLGERHRLRLLSGLTRALTVSMPASATAQVGGQPQVVAAGELETRDHQLVIWGAVSPL